jgi:muconolactone D-isomerase
MEFLVWQRNRVPPDEDSQRMREKLRGVERARARELRDAGILVRLWRVPGTRDAIGLYRTDDATELHDVLASLPTFPWLDIDVQALATHPQEQ